MAELEDPNLGKNTEQTRLVKESSDSESVSAQVWSSMQKEAQQKAPSEAINVASKPEQSTAGWILQNILEYFGYKSEPAKSAPPKPGDRKTAVPDLKKHSHDDEEEDDHTEKDGEEDDDTPPDGRPPADGKNDKGSPLPNAKLYFGSLHGHSVYSDGMCKPKEIFESAKEQGTDFFAVTDHSHKSARHGVKPDNPRHEKQAELPILTDAPQAYTETLHVAKQVSEDGKFVALTGVELGTIGKVGSAEQAGVNHINVIEVPALIETVKGRPRKSNVEIPEELAQFPKPDVIKIKDGDYKALVDSLDRIKDTTGSRAVVQLNHPRYSQDESENLAPEVRGRDYGQKSFSSQEEWRTRFGKYATQLEILNGEAMRQVPTGEFKSHAIHTKDFAGYIEKGLHISPTFGRDSHYCDPIGVPAATGIFAENLDKKSLLDALRARRTIATMDREKLAAYMVVNDKHVMGSVANDTETPDVHVSVTVASEIDPKAKYTAVLWADQNIGDGALADKVQTISITGEDLMQRSNKMRFHGIEHTQGNKGAYYVEIQRRDPGSQKAIRMWTAPVWIEPNNSDRIQR